MQEKDLKGKKKMKKRFWIISCCLLILIITVVMYNRTYFITNDNKELKHNILNFVNRQTVIAKDIDIKKSVDIDNKKYVLYSTLDFLGYTELEKGLNNKYKINAAQYGTPPEIIFRVEQTNKSKYFIIYGKNYDMKIAYIKTSFEDKEYKIEIPQEEYFIAYCPVSKDVQGIMPNKFEEYDKDNNDITDEIFMKDSSST